jgi:hypothetical protein
MDKHTILELFGYPSWSVPAAQQQSLLTVACVLAAFSLGYAIWFSWRERSAFPIFLFIGAGFSLIYEPMGDMLTKVAYPPVDQVSLFTSFGRPIPLWMLPNYVFFFCVPVLLLLQFVVRPGVTTRKWWLTYFGLVIFVTVFEQPGIANDSWRYYGTHEAWSINSYPFWVGFVNAQSLFAIAAGVHLLRHFVLPKGASVLLVFLVPILFVGSHVAVSMPVTSATFSTQNLVIINAAALLTVMMACLTVWIGYKLVSTHGTERLPNL